MIGLKKKIIKLVKNETSYTLYIDNIKKACVLHEGHVHVGCNSTFYGAIGRISLENCKEIENNSDSSLNEWDVDFKMIPESTLLIKPETDDKGYIILRPSKMKQ
jgi:hypothetical protein